MIRKQKNHPERQILLRGERTVRDDRAFDPLTVASFVYCSEVIEPERIYTRRPVISVVINRKRDKADSNGLLYIVKTEEKVRRMSILTSCVATRKFQQVAR